MINFNLYVKCNTFINKLPSKQRREMSSTSIDLERKYEPVEKPKKSERRSERIVLDDVEKQNKQKEKKRSTAGEDDNDEPLPGLRGTRWSTVLMIFLWIACVVMKLLSSLDWTNVDCDVDNDDNDIQELCIEHGVINRISSAFVVFFAVQAFFSICLVRLFDDYWIIKFLAVGGLGVVLLIPESGYFDDEGYQYVARIGGFLFIIIMQILLLDFCYYWKKDFIDKSTTSGRLTHEVASDCMAAMNNIWLCTLLVFSILYILIFVAAMSLLYYYFAKEGCDDNKTIITISLVMMLGALVIQTVLSKNGSIIASGILSCYVAYLTYAAVALNPSSECNPTITSSKFYGVGPQVIGLVLSFLAILYTCVLVTRRMSAIMSTGGATTSGIMKVASGSHSGKSKTGISAEDQLTQSLRTTIFNLNIIFVLLSFYICMTLTNWGTLPEDHIDSKGTNAGHVSMWMQACGAWIAIALYVLGLILPNFKILPKSIWDLKPKM